jgi:hypothetical protein
MAGDLNIIFQVPDFLYELPLSTEVQSFYGSNVFLLRAVRRSF